MLSLDSTRWNELPHAYGMASDIPVLLRQLSSMPESINESEPWFTIWSVLTHQGEVYPATFAAVPHIVSAVAARPGEASSTYFQFPAWVEICRQRRRAAVPADLEEAYFSALNRLPSLVAAVASRPWSNEMVACVLGAIAAAKGESAVAEAALELSPRGAALYLEMLSNQ